MGKRTKTPTKPRTERVYATTVGEIDHLNLTFNHGTGEFSFGGDMMNVFLEATYDRPKGPKVVSRLPQATQSLTFDVDKALETNYDFLCAIDTNTRQINGQRVSVMGVVTFRRSHIPGPAGIESGWTMDAPFAVEFTNVQVDEVENFCWLYAYDEFSARALIQPNSRIGMVVDSNLGKINDYNSGKLPVCTSRMIPANMHFIYASADTGKDSILNTALRMADSCATQILDAVRNETIAFNTKRIDHPLYEGIRMVIPNIIETGPSRNGK